MFYTFITVFISERSSAFVAFKVSSCKPVRLVYSFSSLKSSCHHQFTIRHFSAM